ncbi:hypothetical protein KBD45_00460 [Candidatus Dojkabacteria bacterium]|nr:hypothetical protein [Candidatus Dojkabacteria bacterium]
MIKINKLKVVILIVLVLLQILLLFQIDLSLRHLTNLHYDPITITTLQNPLQLDPDHIRVLSLNIHHGDELDEKEIKEKVEILADYIIQQKIHIAGLQETRTLTRNVNDEQNYRQVALFLQSALERKSYPMYIQLQSNVFNPDNGKNLGFRNATFSIFPLELIEEIDISGGLERRAIISKIKTPKGDIKFINVHVHHKQDENDSFRKFYQDLELKGYLSDPNTIITGDFNNGDIWETYYTDCEIQQSCYKGGIDLVGLPPNVPRDQYNFIPIQRIRDEYLETEHNSKYTFDHPAIIGDFRSRLVLSTPTVEPSINILQPTPQVIWESIDLNNDGRIDISDFAIFVEYYKVGDEKIDFDKDGKNVRDIDDLSYFFENYKSNR